MSELWATTFKVWFFVLSISEKFSLTVIIDTSGWTRLLLRLGIYPALNYGESPSLLFEVILLWLLWFLRSRESLISEYLRLLEYESMEWLEVILEVWINLLHGFLFYKEKDYFTFSSFTATSSFSIGCRFKLKPFD